MVATVSTAHRLLFLGTLIVGFSFSCHGQRVSNWRAYRVTDGLPENACISVTFSPQNKVLARHFSQPLLSELDGYSLTNFPAPEASKSRVYQSPGGQFWTVAPQGLAELNLKTASWVIHPVAEIASPHRSMVPVIDPIPLRPVKQGLVIFLLPERLMVYDGLDANQTRTTLLRNAAQTSLARFSGMSNARDGGLWIAGLRGLAKIPAPVRSLVPETEWREFLVPSDLGFENLQAPHEDDKGGVTVVAESTTNHLKLVAYFDGKNWHARPAGPEKLRQAWRGPDDTCWAMSVEALYQWRGDQSPMTETDEISAREYFDVAIEPGGAFWLATSDGLFRYGPSLWRTPAAVRAINAPIRCLSAGSQGSLWFGAGSKLRRLRDSGLDTVELPPGLFPRGMFPLKNGALLVDTEVGESGEAGPLLQIDPDQTAGKPIFTLEQQNAVQTDPGSARIKTPRSIFRVVGSLAEGLVCLQPVTNNPATGGFALQSYDGTSLQPYVDSPPAATLGTNLTSVFMSQNGDVWLSGDLGTACLHEKTWRAFCSTDQTMPAAPLALTELADGKIWCVTETQLWEFDGRSWSVVRGSFGRVDGLLRCHDGTVWVAANSGVHRFAQGTWLENGIEDGLPATLVRQIYEDPRGQIWAATSRGLSRYHPEADPDPPHIWIEPITETGNDVPEGHIVTLRFHGLDRWKATPTERLVYSFRLDGRDWSAFQEPGRVAFPDLPAGKHYFEVRALDRNFNRGERVQVEFAVVLPWYKETRLVLISTAGLTAALFFAGLALKRHQQLLRSYAEVEQKVAERTQQLEIASRELLHSQKMNALGALAAGIAHDFNNILSIIKGSAQIIEDNLDNPDKVRTRTDRIKTVVEQGAGIVKAMLGFSRESSEHAGPGDLNGVVEDTLKLLGDRFLREVQVTFRPAPGLPSAVLSRDFVQQILLNFIFNAAESMPRQRRIIITTRNVMRLPANLVLQPAAASAYLAVAVQDFGCGISAENLPRIFEPFFTTKALSAHRGTGLGLSMVYELSKRLGAGLHVESVVDQGSTFTLLLPVAEITAPVPSPL